MTGFVIGGIIRAATQTASTGVRAANRASRNESPALLRRTPVGQCRFVCAVSVISLGLLSALFPLKASGWQAGPPSSTTASQMSELESYRWDFGRSNDIGFRRWPDDWVRVKGIGYPAYVEAKIRPRDPELARRFEDLDSQLLKLWQKLRTYKPDLPALPPSIKDAIIDEFFWVNLDGGQFEARSPTLPASRMFQYRFSCEMMTKGLRHDRARAELVFLDDSGDEDKGISDKVLAVYSTDAKSGTRDWERSTIELVRPPAGAAKMQVRVKVERSEDGYEDIKGEIGFDNIRIDQYPQLQITTDEPLGVYAYGKAITTTAKIMGLPPGASKIQFRVFDSNDQEISARLLPVRHRAINEGESKAIEVDSSVSWRLPRIDPGFYRIAASLNGEKSSTLATETTVAVIDQIIGGPPHGCFGWSLPEGNQGIVPRDLAKWLASLGVAWVKYPSWLPPDDTVAAEEVALIFNKLQDAGIQTVGMLDRPPESEVAKYDLRGRSDVVASQLFRDVETWQPLLEPVMTRLALKVRTWQLGDDRDHSFLGRPRLQESIRAISTGLQGFGQPIDVAISWPWLEPQLPNGESSWQAICRSSDPPLGASELDAFLSLSQRNSRSEGARTWLLLDPMPASQYDRDTRIRDLVLRMATVRGHRVQAAFASNPRDPESGLLSDNGRPGELLLPWRTTSRLLGNLRRVGSLQLRSGAQNRVFANSDRAILMLWSAKPTEELIYLGDHIQSVDVWGKIKTLPKEVRGNQPFQRVQIGPVPTFIVGADPQLLSFRMSVDIKDKEIDSLLGQVQKLSVEFSNSTRDSLVGDMRVLPPATWTVETPRRGWEALAGRTVRETFRVVLSNTAKVGEYEFPIQFELDTIPPKRITVYRKVNVGPEGLDLKVSTRLLRSGELRVQIELTNHTAQPQPYDCMLFPPPGNRQFQRRLLTVDPGETIKREIYWPDGKELLGKTMLLRAAQQNGQRVLNYPIDVTR